MSSTRTPPSLSQILAEFNAARSQKTAADEPGADPAAPMGETAEAAPGQNGSALAAAADDVVDAARKLDQAKKNAVSAKDGVVDAAQALKDIAQEAVESHTDALAKEARLFGEIFGASAMTAMHKAASDTDASKAVYMTQGIGSGDLLQEKLGTVYDEAYSLTLKKLAEDEAYAEALRQFGYDPDDPEVMAALAQQEAAEQGGGDAAGYAQGLYPQSLVQPQATPATVAAAAGIAPGTPLQQAGGAVRDAAQAARAAAEAASALVDQVQGETVDLPKLAHAAYVQTLRHLGS